MGDSEVHALDGVSVDIDEGEFVAVMGPSGSGKSTFMNVLGCLDRPTQRRLPARRTSGCPSWRGDQLAAVRNRQHRLRVPALQPARAHPGARERRAAAGLRRGSRKKERTSGRMAMLGKVGLGDRADHHPAQLSGGQQQRVAIARALVTEPLLILADEPTGALDSHTSLEIMALFQELNRQGMTVVLVTHEPDVARFARRILRFRDGKRGVGRGQPAGRRAAAAASAGMNCLAAAARRAARARGQQAAQRAHHARHRHRRRRGDRDDRGRRRRAGARRGADPRPRLQPAAGDAGLDHRRRRAHGLRLGLDAHRGRRASPSTARSPRRSPRRRCAAARR